MLAAGALVYLVSQPGTEPRGPFSPWEPQSEDAQDRAQEIANFVGGNYRLDPETQLVTVQAAPPRVQDFPLAAVAIGSAPGGATFSGDNIPVFPADDTIVYILCGLGQECAISEGEPSEERQRLLRREALELALYTFRYVDDIDNVVVFMPPPPGFRPSYALFFQRPELEDLVDRPLRDTLTSRVHAASERDLALRGRGDRPADAAALLRLPVPAASERHRRALSRGSEPRDAAARRDDAGRRGPRADDA